MKFQQVVKSKLLTEAGQTNGHSRITIAISCEPSARFTWRQASFSPKIKWNKELLSAAVVIGVLRIKINYQGHNSIISSSLIEEYKYREHFKISNTFLCLFLIKCWLLGLDFTKCHPEYQTGHWRSSHYAVTHMHNKNSNIQGRSP